MKKNFFKTFLGILITIILLLGTVTILIIKGIMPNPFLDTEDLECEITIGDPTAGPQGKTVLIFKFGKDAIITSYIEKNIQYFLSNEDAKQEYNKIKSNSKSSNIELDGDSIIYSTEYFLEIGKGYYGKSKKEIKNIFINEYSYICK